MTRPRRSLRARLVEAGTLTLGLLAGLIFLVGGAIASWWWGR